MLRTILQGGAFKMERKARILFLIQLPVGHLKLFLHQWEGLAFLYATSEDEIKQADSSRMTLIAFYVVRGHKDK